MLTELLIGAGRWARRTAGTPWASGIGLARTLLAAGTCGTLLATSPDVLLSPLADGVVPPVCAGVRGAGLWCVVPYLEGQAARALAILILLVVASGWRPRITAVPHWYVSWSLVANVTIQDGGDQITAVLTILLVPVALTDPRRWHWQPPRRDEVGPRHIVANAALALIRLQVAVVYLHASIAKLGVEEWSNGTAMYYWFRHGVFGAPDWLRPVTDAMTDSPFGVALLTWGTVAFEFALGIAILLGRRAKLAMLVAGMLFHHTIALAMGLVSFDAAMNAALLLYLLPLGQQLSVRPFVARWSDAGRRVGLPAR